MNFNPWQHMGDLHADWVVRTTNLKGLHEVMCWGRRVIMLDDSSGIADRRCHLAHAIGHIELAHRGDVYNLKEEAAADRWSAKMLIDLKPLAHSLEWNAWQLNWQTAATLRVNIETLTNRLTYLHPAERAYLTRRRAEQEHAA